jgi:broad specificity phosphatase PhoE
MERVRHDDPIWRWQDERQRAVGDHRRDADVRGSVTERPRRELVVVLSSGTGHPRAGMPRKRGNEPLTRIEHVRRDMGCRAHHIYGDRDRAKGLPRRAMIGTMTSPSELWLVRHGETEWSRDARHTSTTELSLLPEGEEAARRLGARLALSFDLVLASPRLRARRTAELAGFGDAIVDADLAEWDYGAYEGLTTLEIRDLLPDWTVWTHGAPGGESPEQVAGRLDRVIGRVRGNGGRVLCFGHGHSLRALAARWIGEPVTLGRNLALDTASLSVLGYDRDMPVIVHWNE